MLNVNGRQQSRDLCMRAVYWLFLVASIAAAAGCGGYRPAPDTIQGAWRAESFDLRGLKLPISPEIEFTSNSMNTAGQALRIERIELKGPEVTVYFPTNVGLTFAFESKDRMFFALPFIDYRIYYNRIRTH